MVFIIKKPLTTENILSQITDYDIFKYYCIPFIQVNKGFCSELRPDHDPDCYIYLKGNKLYYKDFGSGEYLDCFDYVMTKYGLTFQESLKLISRDFRLNLIGDSIGSTPTNQIYGHHQNVSITKKIPDVIDITVRKWDINDKKYWKDKYGIGSKTLDFFKVFPISYYFYNDSLKVADKYSYAYYFGKLPDSRNAFKIYNPYANKKNKWINNVPGSLLQGMNQLPWIGEKLIITKSLKDIMVLYNLNIPAIAPHGENHYFDEEVIESLKKRFENVYILYDNDPPGKKASNTMSKKYGLSELTIPEEYNVKDVSDFVEKYSYELLKEKVLWSI